jgi:hypothetical protein
MQCLNVRNLGERYNDGALSASMRAAIDAHLAVCTKCTAEYDGITAIKKMFTATAIPALPEAAVDELIAAVRVKGYRDKREHGLGWRLPDWWTEAAAGMRAAYGLVFILLTIAGIYMGQDLWRQRPPAGSAANGKSDYPGIVTFVDMQPGSVEQTYYELTSYTMERGGR